MNTNVMLSINWHDRFETFEEFFSWRCELEDWLDQHVDHRTFWAGARQWGFENEIDALAVKLKFGL